MISRKIWEARKILKFPHCGALNQILTWEMVRIPFTNSHTEGINIFVQLIQKSNTLNNHIVRLVNIEFHFTPGVSMTKTKLGLGGRLSTHALNKLSKV